MASTCSGVLALCLISALRRVHRRWMSRICASVLSECRFCAIFNAFGFGVEDSIHIRLVVAQEVRFRAFGAGFRYPVPVVRCPLPELRRHVPHGVRAVSRQGLPVQQPPLVRQELVHGLQDLDRIAPARGVPAHELEILGVHPGQLVADVEERPAVERVVIGELHLYADHEIQLLDAQVVGRPVGHVRLRGREPQCVLVTAPVHPLAGMERLGLDRYDCPLRGLPVEIRTSEVFVVFSVSGYRKNKLNAVLLDD